ncbi:uncharacterized protein KZ484_000640 isoform 2-T2 [Pholidichthys leucotaenia]
MDARPRTPGNPISVQGSVTPLTGKTPKFNERHVEESDPLQIKEEQEEFWTHKEVEEFIQKQELDIVTVTSISTENEHREPNSDQLLCLTSAVTEHQDEEGSRHVDSGSAESEELKMKKRHLKTASHHEGVGKILFNQYSKNQAGLKFQ